MNTPYSRELYVNLQQTLRVDSKIQAGHSVGEWLLSLEGEQAKRPPISLKLPDTISDHFPAHSPSHTCFLFWIQIAQSSFILRALAEAIPSTITHFPTPALGSCLPSLQVSDQMSPSLLVLTKHWLQNSTPIHALLYICFCLFIALDTLWCLINICIWFYSFSITRL